MFLAILIKTPRKTPSVFQFRLIPLAFPSYQFMFQTSRGHETNP